MLSFVSIYSILSLLKLLTLYLDWMVNKLLEISKDYRSQLFHFSVLQLYNLLFLMKINYLMKRSSQQTFDSKPGHSQY